MPLGWAVISTGLHVDHKIAPAINATPDAELVAVCSRDQDRAEACAAKHGAKAAYSDLGALLRDSRVDAVFIASPNALHAQHALQAAQAGKHVFSEKPMTTTLDDAVAMVRTCRTRGVKLGVAQTISDTSKDFVTGFASGADWLMAQATDTRTSTAIDIVDFIP